MAVLVKSFAADRYERLLSRRTGGDPVAMAREDVAIRIRVHNAIRAVTGDGGAAPTPAQLNAGNYQKHHTQFQGLDITIVNPRGTLRTGVDPGGHEWAVSMANDYGYIRGSLGVDGDHVDCYVGPCAASEFAYIVHQRRAGDWTAYDEDKCMLGFADEASARAAYLLQYDDPRFLGPVTVMPMAEFKAKVLATRTRPQMIKANSLVIFRKAFVQAYDRHGHSGAVIHVNAHSTRTAPAHGAPPVLSFRSGASAPADFRGYVKAGVPVGVSLAEIGPGSATWPMISAYARSGGDVFVDSGAFTAFTKGQPVDFDRVLGLYRQLADSAKGGRLHFVMPDVVGDQAASFDVLTKHRASVRALIADRHDALVPIQRGQLSPSASWDRVCNILGTDDFTLAIPSNEVAFDLDDIRELFSGTSRPARVHLLGVAADKAKLGSIVKLIHQLSPSTTITSDANRLRAKVGQGRAVTEESARQRSVLADDRWSTTDITELMDRVLEHTNWLTPAQVRQLASDLGVTDPAEQEAWIIAHRAFGLADLINDADGNGMMTEHAVRGLFAHDADRAVRSGARSAAITADEKSEHAQLDLFGA